MEMVMHYIYIVYATKPIIYDHGEMNVDGLASFVDFFDAENYLASIGFERETIAGNGKDIPTGNWRGLHPGYATTICDDPDDFTVTAWIDIIELHHPENCF